MAEFLINLHVQDDLGHHQYFCIALDKTGYHDTVFLISAQKHMLWVIINYPQNIVLWRNEKNICIFQLKKNISIFQMKNTLSGATFLCITFDMAHFSVVYLIMVIICFFVCLFFLLFFFFFFFFFVFFFCCNNDYGKCLETSNTSFHAFWSKICLLCIYFLKYSVEWQTV